MTKDQLKNVMEYQLKNFNDEEVPINNDTIHNQVLSPDDGFSPPTSSQQIYKAFIRWTIRKQNHEDKAWPSHWMDLSVAELADKLI